MYIELHTASAFSFLDGASLPATLVARAAELGYPAVALLDRDGVYGAPQFYRAAKAAGIRAIVGAELTMDSGTGHWALGTGGANAHRRVPSAKNQEPSAKRQVPSAQSRVSSAQCPVPSASLWSLPVLVASAEGYRNLCRVITVAKLRAPKGEGVLTLDDLAGSTGGLVALIGREALRAGRHGVGGLVERLLAVFGREQLWIELQRHLRRDDQTELDSLVDLAAAFHLPVMASNGVRFAAPEDRPLYDVLTCIRHKTTLAAAGRKLTANAERYLKPRETMARLFADLPQALAGTEALAEQLEFTLANLGYRFPEYPVPAGDSPASFLRRITQVGARDRYRPYHDRAEKQIRRELDLIEKLDLAGYFLIVWDIVNFCRQQGILVQGRGSAANSAVCYALGITAVDPVGMDLLFERFLSEERGEWPDIDLDLPSGDRRERVIQYVYDRYGRPGTAMTANVITYRGRSAAREVGKVLGIAEDEIDRLAKMMNQFEFVDPRETMARHLSDAGLDPDDGRYRQFAKLWVEIQDLPRHLGQHSGGMVLCHGRLDEIVPLENAAMPGRVVVQWDKDDCADLGLVKVDLLGLGMMAALEEALAIVNAGTGHLALGTRRNGDTDIDTDISAASEDLFPVPSPERPAPVPRVPSAQCPVPARLDLAHLPPDDPAVYRMLQQADTVGVFQVESRAQMATLPRLRPEHFYDLVVEVAIIRPGPIVGNMVHPFLRRRRGDEAVTYPHPSLEPVLARTLGVPLFQEQLLRMAMVVAGFTGGEAEELRRAMGFKRSVKRMQPIETRLREGMARNGITGAAADQIVLSITSFALYGFPESHAASFALIVYASAYLKAHFPAAFYTALLNNQPMGFYHPATLVKDAQRRGVRFAPVDIDVSGWNCAVQADGSIRMGLRYVRGLREDAGRRIEGHRAKGIEGQRAQGKGQIRIESPREESESSSAAARASGGGAPRASKESPREESESSSAAARASGSPQPFTLGVGPQRTSGSRAPRASKESWPRRFSSMDDLVSRTGLRQDELRTLAEIGALAAFGGDRRTALWQAERAGRPAGPLLMDGEEDGDDDSGAGHWALGTGEERGLELFARRNPVSSAGSPEPSAGSPEPSAGSPEPSAGSPEPSAENPEPSAESQVPRAQSRVPSAQCPVPTQASPLTPMTLVERVRADYDGTGLTIGPHPMALVRASLAARGVARATDLPRERAGRRVRVAGAVITRQRPGTAKGFVFLSLEDETGIANIIITPDVFAANKRTIVEAPYLICEGALQNQDGAVSVKADRIDALRHAGPEVESHDFH